MDAHEFNQIFQHRTPGKVNPLGVQRRIDYRSSNDPVYIGFSLAGTAETTAGWYIEYLEYDVDGRYVKSTFSPKNVKWSERLTQAYA